MVEVRDIGINETAPDADCVVIERAGGGRFRANGSVAGKANASFWTPPNFDSIEAAIQASITWATANDVPVVYVKGIR
jgi:hypothetical protein